MSFIIVEYTFVSLGVFIMTMGLIWRIIKNKSIMPTAKEDKKYKVDPRVVMWRNKHKKVVGIVLMVPLCTLLVIVTYFIVIPYLKDVKYIINGNFPEFTGTIVSEITERNKARESVVISNGNRSIEIQVEVHGEKKGDFVNVLYLPNSKVGALY